MLFSDKLTYTTSDRSEKESIDIYSYHEQNAGRLIVDPECVAAWLNSA
jgi:hypothetical protein